jgi:hypothetical protein
MIKALDLLEKYNFKLSTGTDDEVVLSKLTENGIINIIIDEENVFYSYMDKENKKILICFNKNEITYL